MKKTHLVACPACARHVRVNETACPFCSTTLGDDVHAASPKRAPRERLGRAALVAFGAGTIAVACGGSVGQGVGEKDGGRANRGRARRAGSATSSSRRSTGSRSMQASLLTMAASRT